MTVKRSPEEWGKELGYWIEPRWGAGFWTPAMAAARKIYGWDLHAYHYVSDPIQLTEKQFAAAMKAAAGNPVTPPYGPAVSKCKKRKSN